MSWMIAALLLGAGAWTFLARWRTPGLLRGHAIGAWLGLLLLIRAELVLVLALVVSWQLCAIAARPPRARRVEAITACIAAFIAIVMPRVLQLHARGEASAVLTHFRERSILEAAPVAVPESEGALADQQDR